MVIARAFSACTSKPGYLFSWFCSFHTDCWSLHHEALVGDAASGVDAHQVVACGECRDIDRGAVGGGLDGHHLAAGDRVDVDTAHAIG